MLVVEAAENQTGSSATGQANGCKPSAEIKCIQKSHLSYRVVDCDCIQHTGFTGSAGPVDLVVVFVARSPLDVPRRPH